MAAPSPAALRFLAHKLHPPKPRIPKPPSHLHLTTKRHMSNTPSLPSEMETTSPTPRHAQTPPLMRAPTKSRVWRSIGGRHDVNKSAARLDEMYRLFLGRNGPNMLSDETKWLCVTHKSFDHGRRGFNDRLAFLGKRVVEKEVVLGLVGVGDRGRGAMGMEMGEGDEVDEWGRTVERDEKEKGVEVLLEGGREWLTYHKQVARVAQEYGLPEVMRWVPKNPNSLQASGCDMVYAQAMFAVVGALALEKGAAIANEVARERLLEPLGMSTYGHRQRSKQTVGEVKTGSSAVAQLEQQAQR